jgi:hypothetical protein
MKLSLLSVIIAVLLLAGCAKQDVGTEKQPTANTPPPVSNAKYDEDTRVPGKPAADGRSAIKLYEHLKTKGWRLDPAKPNEFREFNSEEAISFRDESKIGYLLLRYQDNEKAQTDFAKIDQIYKQRWGGAVKSKNFIVAVFGVLGQGNNADVIKLAENDFARLQSDMDDFTK